MEPDRYVCLCALSKVFAYKCAVGRQLMNHFGGPAAVFSAPREELSAILSGAGAAYASQLLDSALLDWAAEEQAWAARYGIRLLGIGDPAYPRRLAECDDAPLLLYARGDADLNAGRVLAVVGTRKATWQGREACRRLIARLACLDEKPLIVSGLALGVDGCAHATALEAGLPTAGVLPCGLDEIYPRQHRALACRMVEQGVLVTDFVRGTAPAAFTFLRRNRIIAGLADATLVVESYRKGGSLITASLAASYNREVFAVPGRMTDVSFAGCNRLVERQEATLVADEETIPSVLGWCSASVQPPRRVLIRPDDPPVRRAALRLLESRGPLAAEDLSVLLRIGAQEASVLLLELEMDGRVVADGSKFYVSL